VACLAPKLLLEDPIPIPRDESLVLLKHAADYITKLPKAEQDRPEWQTAIHCLIGAAEGRDFLMHARIGMLRALNAGKLREFSESKGHPWGRRKLERDPTPARKWVTAIT
jgi:hypothetical protein